MALPPFRTWATNTNYPAGADPWNGQPTKVVHPGPLGGFVPNQGAAAQYFNDLFHDIFAQDQLLADNTIDLDPTAEVVTTADGTVVAPVNAIGAYVEACGGGGGGGGGGGDPGSDFRNSGGGGGGGAPKVVGIIPIVGGETYNIDIGAGGAGGVGSTVDGVVGADGADTTITRASTSDIVFTARGAQRGSSGQQETFGAGGKGIVVIAGGAPLRQESGSSPINAFRSISLESASVLYLTAVGGMGVYATPHHGGFGSSNNFSQSHIRAGYSPEGFKGGAAGAYGSPSTSGAFQAGGCGGGGGAGPYGDGGAGGDGGAPNNAGSGGVGTVGTAAAANTGAGGGGGGSAGAGSSGTPTGGAAGAGGSGRCRMIWILKGNT